MLEAQKEGYYEDLLEDVDKHNFEYLINYIHPNLEIRMTKDDKGRGVFATENIE